MSQSRESRDVPISVTVQWGVDGVWRAVASVAGESRRGKGESAEQSAAVAIRELLGELRAQGKEASLWR